jgi:hypothetical protein
MFNIQLKKITFNKVLLKNVNKLFLSFNLNYMRSVQTSSTRNGNCETNLYIKKIQDGVKKLRIFDDIDLSAADLNWPYLLDEKNLSKINENKMNRNANGDIFKVVYIYFLISLSKLKSNSINIII